MRKIHAIFMLVAMLATQQVFASDILSVPPADSSGSKFCTTIANACLAAGFSKTEPVNKGVWHDCMKPIILGQTVSGVTYDSVAAKSCRAYKITELRTELKELEKSS